MRNIFAWINSQLSATTSVSHIMLDTLHNLFKMSVKINNPTKYEIQIVIWFLMAKTILLIKSTSKFMIFMDQILPVTARLDDNVVCFKKGGRRTQWS